MPRSRSARNICLECFGDLGEDRVCRACGKKADDTPAPPHQLAKRSLLMKRYMIANALGEGGFGITYLAWDVQRRRKVAIKEFYPGGYVSRDPRSSRMIINSKQHHAACNRGLKRFIDEARHLRSINELAGIVSVYDFFSANNTAYIVMEYLDGISLKNYVRRKGRLDGRTTLTILKPVILSLAEVHKTGLIHRDVSPDNILITKANEVKLIDFGASKEVGGGQTVSIVLKQGFAPEEQYRRDGSQGPWTDIYALGVTIYYCLTGQLPPESIQRIYEDKIVPPSELGVRISPEHEAAVMKALAVFAKDRYRALDGFIADVYSPAAFSYYETAGAPDRAAEYPVTQDAAAPPGNETSATARFAPDTTGEIVTEAEEPRTRAAAENDTPRNRLTAADLRAVLGHAAGKNADEFFSAMHHNADQGDVTATPNNADEGDVTATPHNADEGDVTATPHNADEVSTATPHNADEGNGANETRETDGAKVVDAVDNNLALNFGRYSPRTAPSSRRFPDFAATLKDKLKK